MGRATPAIIKHPLLWVALFVVGALVLAGHIPDRSSQSAAIIDVEPTRQRQPSKKVQPTTENPNAPLVPHEQRSAANDETDCKEGEKRQECLMQWRATKAAEWQAKSADDQLWYSKLGIYLITATFVATAIAAAGAALAARSARDQVSPLYSP